MYGVFHIGASRITGNPSHGFSRGSLRPSLVRADAIDPDAAAWIAKVEAKDGQALEPAVVAAIDVLFSGLREDAVIEHLDSWRIYAGPRTLDGALTPVSGPAPSNDGPFVDGNLSRAGGLKGNGSNKSLGLNVYNDDYPRNSIAVWTFFTEMPTPGSARNFVSAGFANEAGATRIAASSLSPSRVAWRNRSSTVDVGDDMISVGFLGHSRITSTHFRGIGGSKNILYARDSQAPGNIQFREFAAENSVGDVSGFSDHRSLASGVGPGLTETQMLSIKARFETYWETLKIIFA